MTIGMLIETVAAKAAAIHGTPTQDATPFRRYPRLQTGNSYIDRDGVKGQLRF
jgi:DNA-directed RNA polymerase beta subunit